MTPDGRTTGPVTTAEVDEVKDSMIGDRFMIRFSEERSSTGRWASG
jgi:hypothetical protein